MTPDKLSREDILDWIKYHDWYDDTSTGIEHSEKVTQAIRKALTDLAAMREENERLTKDRDYWKQEQGRVHTHWRTAETDLKKAEADLALAEPVLAELTELLSECLFFLPSFDDPWGAITFKGGTFGIRRLVTDALVRLDAQQARAAKEGK